jgi:DNA-binding transcriptional LysR family regulator
LGVGIIPEMAIQAMSEGPLVYRQLVDPDLARTIVIAERRDATLSPAAAALKAALMAAFKTRSSEPKANSVRR